MTRTRASVVIWLWVAWSSVASAQSRVMREAWPYPPLARVDFSSALLSRASTLEHSDLQMRYGGLSPSELRLSAALFSMNHRFGAFGDFGFGWFTVEGVGFRGEALRYRLKSVRSALGGVARFAPSPRLTLEAQVGYGYDRLPLADASTLVLRDVSMGYHGIVLGGVAQVHLQAPFGLGLRARMLPYAFKASSPLGRGRAFAASFGMQLTFGRLQISRSQFSVLVDYEIATTRIFGSEVRAQSLEHRGGLGIRWALLDPRPPVTPPSKTAWVQGTVRFADSAEPASAVTVQLGASTTKTNAQGRFVFEDVAPAKGRLRVQAEGYRIYRHERELTANQDVEWNVVLERATGPGTIRGLVLTVDPSNPSQKIPVPDAAVQTPQGIVRSQPDGSFVVENAGPGPVPLKFQAKKYVNAEEVIAVPAEGLAMVEVVLQKTGSKAMATLSGRVRRISGVPVAATILIDALNLQTQTDKQGRFKIRVPGGRYTVRFRAEGHHPQAKVIDVADGDQTLFYIDLTPAD